MDYWQLEYNSVRANSVNYRPEGNLLSGAAHIAGADLAGPLPRTRVVRLRIAELLRQRGLKPYDLITGAGFSPHASYKLASEDGRFERIGADTIDRLCAFFDVAPGELFAREPEAGARRRQARLR